MKIIVIGAGAWGTALAVAAASSTAADASRRHDVSLWARDAAQASAMRTSRSNPRYLPGVALPAALSIVSDTGATPAFPSLASQCDLAVVATPMSALRPLLQALARCPVPVVWLCKGFEHASGLLGLTVIVRMSPRDGLRETGADSRPGDSEESHRRRQRDIDTEHFESQGADRDGNRDELQCDRTGLGGHGRNHR